MKLATARQGDKEPGLRDDVLTLSRAAATARADIDASNSPILRAWVWGLRTDH